MITTDENMMLASHVEFMHDLHYGLSRKRKRIPSKYFYDSKGCELFTAITRHEDYYLTQCEIEILTNHMGSLSRLFSNEPFNLIELGPGEGIKSKIIIDQLIKYKSPFTYVPIDISRKYLDDLACDLTRMFPGIQLNTIESDWFDGLRNNSLDQSKRNIVLFLGSSIGNFTPKARERFLKNIMMTLNNGDYLFVGFDLCKNHDILLRAYDDSSGITRQFNFNLLDRINHELGGNFDLSQFEHRPCYNIIENAMESYLVSRINQSVKIRSMNQTFQLSSNETIHVESSYKFKPNQIAKLAKRTGYDIIDNFLDSKNYYLCSLWKVNK